MDLETGRIEWFRERNDNYIVDAWLVLRDKNAEIIEGMNDQLLPRPST